MEDRAAADIVWDTNVDESQLQPHQRYSEFPNERAMVWKNMLFRTVNRAYGEVPYVPLKRVLFRIVLIPLSVCIGCVCVSVCVSLYLLSDVVMHLRQVDADHV